ncbi:MAG TPA: ElyC/SanA/YdcF family protein, partial [Candidatus Saccharimonadales bacterium]|nr:ElyC/SanA/YdcF family protein [Candidatus Saccharimonadales bacterium]
MKSAIRELLRGVKKNRLRLAILIAGGGLLIIGWMVWADHRCEQAAGGRVFHSVDSVPAREIGLVLGTSKETRRGKPNLHFNQRITAAATLYHAGKVRHLLVSGDNHTASYDEPTDMRAALMAAGVPADAIT